jgi:hypothetical protein
MLVGVERFGMIYGLMYGVMYWIFGGGNLLMSRRLTAMKNDWRCVLGYS